MQILHPFAGSIQQYSEQLSDPENADSRIMPTFRDWVTEHGFPGHMQSA